MRWDNQSSEKIPGTPSLGQAWKWSLWIPHPARCWFCNTVCLGRTASYSSLQPLSLPSLLPSQFCYQSFLKVKLSDFPFCPERLTVPLTSWSRRCPPSLPTPAPVASPYRSPSDGGVGTVVAWDPRTSAGTHFLWAVPRPGCSSRSPLGFLPSCQKQEALALRMLSRWCLAIS